MKEIFLVFWSFFGGEVSDEPKMMPADVQRYHPHEGLPLSEWLDRSPVTNTAEYRAGCRLHFDPSGAVIGRYNFNTQKFQRGTMFNGRFEVDERVGS